MFKNPPKCVAKLFDEVIKAHFQNVFKRIVFAIKCVDKKTMNFDAFSECFSVDKSLEDKVSLFTQHSRSALGTPISWSTGLGCGSTGFGNGGSGFGDGNSGTGFS